MTPSLQSWGRYQRARYLLRRGTHLLQQGNIVAAITTLTGALEDHPRPEAVFLQRGLAYWQQQDTVQALADFEQAIALDPESVRAYGHRGLIRYDQGDEAGALADWAIALQYQPGDATIRYNRGLVYLQKQAYPEALLDLDQALEQNPLMAEAYLHRGKAKQALADVSGAVKDWELALCNDLRLEEAHQLLEQVRQQSEQTKQNNQFRHLVPADCALTLEQQGSLLTILLHRPVGIPINYFQLPNQLRERLVELQLPEVRRFRLVAKSGESSLSEWDHTYGVYDKAPCPPTHWKAALLSTVLLFPPLGILALVYSAQVKQAYQQGDYPIAAGASQAVKKLCLSSGALMGLMLFFLASYGVYTHHESKPHNPAAKTALVSKPEAAEKDLSPQDL